MPTTRPSPRWRARCWCALAGSANFQSANATSPHWPRWMIRCDRSQRPSWSRTLCRSSRLSAEVHAGGGALRCRKSRSWSDRIPICSILWRAMPAAGWTTAMRRTSRPETSRLMTSRPKSYCPRRVPDLPAQLRNQRGSRRERQRFLGEPLLDCRRKAVALQKREHAGDQILGNRGTTGHTDIHDAVQPARVDLCCVVHPMCRLCAGFQGDLHQPYRVGGVCAPHHDDQVSMASDLLNGELPVLSGVTDVVAGGIHQQRELCPEPIDGLQRLIDAQGGLA